jgi:hypothetical protein
MLMVAHPRSPAVERVHLHATIAEAEVTLDQLSATFSRELLAEELAALRVDGRLVEREQRVLVPRAGAIARTRTVKLASREDVHRAVSFGVCAPAYELVERSTGVIIAEVEGARATCAAYPRRVLVRNGRRYVVLPVREQDQLERRRIVCETSAAHRTTTPIRRLTLEPVERRQRGAAEPVVDRRLGALLAIGGAGFWLQTREVRIREQVLGARSYAADGRRAEEAYDDAAIECSYPTRATLLVLPAQPFGDIANPALHALVHLLRATLPTALRFDDDDLAVTQTTVDDRPALAFLDLHPEGAGFADAISLDILRPVLLLARDVCVAGGERAIAAVPCLAPSADGALDPTGAQRVLDALLG